MNNDIPMPQKLGSVRLRQSMMAMLLMFATVAAAYWLTPTKKLANDVVFVDIATAVPTQFGRWSIDTSMTPIAPSPDQTEALTTTYDQIISYTYVNMERQRVMLSIAYGSAQKQGLRAHRQEVCYRAQGFSIGRTSQIDFPVLGHSIQATQFVAQLGTRVEPVTYWFTMGDHVVRSFIERQVVQLQYALSGFIPDGYLFRVSTLGPETADTRDLRRQFTEELVASMTPELRRRLLGAR